MRGSTTIYLASDLTQKRRTILDQARAGGARLRATDGLSLVLLPEERLEALETVARCAGNLCAVERALASTPGRPALQEYGEWTWLRVFDVDDLQGFVSDMRDALMIASREQSTLHMLRC
ncbi:MAG: hypothetical protein HYY04_09125 [Chloroflexi bacterium]|nr:hypothetical protein [Chloroflexota bacterium]